MEVALLGSLGLVVHCLVVGERVTRGNCCVP